METSKLTKLTANTADNKYKTTLVEGFCLSDQNARELTLEEQGALKYAKVVFVAGAVRQAKKVLEKAGFIVDLD